MNKLILYSRSDLPKNYTGEIYYHSHPMTCFYKKGEYHNENGPAIIFPNGNKEYHLDGVLLSKEKWFSKLSEDQKEKLLWHLDTI